MISARRASQFRYAYGAGFTDARSLMPGRSLKTTSRWWNDAYIAGQDYGTMEFGTSPALRRKVLHLLRWTHRLNRMQRHH